MAMLGEQFMVGEEICGAVISIRYAVSIFLISLYLTNFFLFSIPKSKVCLVCHDVL